MRAVHRRSVRPSLAWPALLATVLLLIALLGGYAFIESRRLERDLSRDLEDRAMALIDILEASSKNAIASNALLEDAVSQRLLDNARFIDFLVARTPRPQELIGQVATENKLAKVDLLDLAGQPISPLQAEAQPPGPWKGGRGPGGSGQRGPGTLGGPDEQSGSTGPARGSRMMMGWMMAPPAGTPALPPETRPMPGMPFMWGHRWGRAPGNPALLFPSLPKDAKIQQFWEGSAFGVAVPAQSFPGVIVVHADAEYLLNFRREIGVERLIEELGRQSGVAAVALLDRDLVVLASSDPREVGRKVEDRFLRAAWDGGTVQARRQTLADGREVYEIVKPFVIEKTQAGLVRLDLGTGGLVSASRQAQRSILSYSLALLLVGIGGVVAIFWLQARHLAERRALEAAMAQEQRLAAVGNLAAGVAHDIRNPLNAISIGLQRLRKEFAPPEPEPRREYARFTEIMQAEVGRLNTIVDRFLSLARPTRLALTEEPLAPVLEELLVLLSTQASAQQVRVVQDLRLGDARVRLDRQQLTHAFMNIFLNAIQAMPGGGTLTIRGEVLPFDRAPVTDQPIPAHPVMRISISDSGAGIPVENLDRIFEPYFTTKEGGTGLGLAMAHKIVQEHRGRIHAESAVGSGSTFVVVLPVATPAASNGAE